MAATLYTYPDNFKAQKVLIAAKYSKKDIKLADYVAGETNKSESFLKKFPLGKVPAYEEGGFLLSETNVIARWVGNDAIRGGNHEAEVLDWIRVSDNTIYPSACTWVYPTLGIMQYNQQATEKAKITIKSVLNVLNNHLSTKFCLVGSGITQADISVACTLLMLYTNVLEPNFRKEYGNVNRWFVALVNQPEFKAIWGEVKLCEKMAQFDAKKFNEISGNGAPKKTEPAKKEVLSAKKEVLKTPTKVAGDTIDPWANTSNRYDIDLFKQIYDKDYEVGMKYFFENEPEDYSIWHCKYKYNNELKFSFHASNVIGGFSQRIEDIRKFVYASMLVLKGSNHFEIEGVWLWRGHEFVFDRHSDWQLDSEHYDWNKLDIKDEEDRKTIETFWTWKGDFQGRSLEDGIIMK